MGIAFALLSATAFSISNIMIRKGFTRNNHTDNGFFMTVITNVIVLGIIFAVTRLFSGFTFQFSWTAFLFFVLSGLLTTGLGRLALFGSFSRIGPTRGTTIKNASPIFTVIFALFVLGEAVTLGAVAGMVILISAILLQGIYLVRLHQKRTREIAVTTEQQGEFHAQWIGYLLAMVSALSFGLGLGIRKQGLLVWNDAFAGAFIGAVTSLIFLLVYEVFRGELRVTVKRNFSKVNPYFIVAGVMTSLGPLFFFLGASFTQVSYVSVVAGTEPLITSLLSALFLKGEEQLTVLTWISVLLVLVGTAMIVLA
jgi:drug/metabolite transporter (DMT)-like permease